jgi:hypothetical protein
MKVPMSKGIKKASKSGKLSTPDANVKKLNAFFSTTLGSACSGASP